MGRSIPFPSEAHTLIHSALFISLVVAWVAAAMVVIVSLCAERKPPSDPPSASPPSPHNESVAKPASETTTTPTVQATTEQGEGEPHQEAQEEQVTVIEMTPDVATHGPIPPSTVLPASASKRKMSLSFGKGLPEKIRTSRRERSGNGGGDSEDSIWKKTIILGEKCKVSSDDEEEEVAGEKGNRQKHYHPRTPRSRQTSRNNSFAYPDETPS
nr:PREDICTED: uncharacterized protein LOC108951517 [Musa acuminata subsp. malaccensis]